jgi:hypothetical protein
MSHDKHHVAFMTAWTGYITLHVLTRELILSVILASHSNADDASLMRWGSSVKNYDLLEI